LAQAWPLVRRRVLACARRLRMYSRWYAPLSKLLGRVRLRPVRLGVNRARERREGRCLVLRLTRVVLRLAEVHQPELLHALHQRTL
jgi:hypothetical protein